MLFKGCFDRISFVVVLFFMPVIENNYEEVKNVHIISTSKNEEKKKKKLKKPDL